jgi:hypothetical protein
MDVRGIATGYPDPRSPRFRFNICSDGFIEIIDLNEEGRMSVTNGAEYVIKTLAEAGFEFGKKTVIYRDSEGEWDEIRIVDDRFDRFVALRWSDGARIRTAQMARQAAVMQRRRELAKAPQS